jgi:hypothetical protein
MNFNDFNAQIQDVIDWNAVARNNTHTFTEQDLANQTAYVHEEVMETIAGLANKDLKETLDGIADTFVTLSYKYFLMRQEFNADFNVEDLLGEDISNDPRMQQDYMVSLASTISSNNLFANGLHDIEFTLSLLYLLMHTAQELYKVNMHDVVDAVMVSNWSKFPPLQGINPTAMCEWIEEVRKRENVNFRTTEVAGVKRVTFRDNFGEGKIMKPSTFVEPDLSALLK